MNAETRNNIARHIGNLLHDHSLGAKQVRAEVERWAAGGEDVAALFHALPFDLRVSLFMPALTALLVSDYDWLEPKHPMVVDYLKLISASQMTTETLSSISESIIRELDPEPDLVGRTRAMMRVVSSSMILALQSLALDCWRERYVEEFDRVISAGIPALCDKMERGE